MFVPSIYGFIEYFSSTSFPPVRTRFTSPSPDTVRGEYQNYEYQMKLYINLHKVIISLTLGERGTTCYGGKVKHNSAMVVIWGNGTFSPLPAAQVVVRVTLAKVNAFIFLFLVFLIFRRRASL